MSLVIAVAWLLVAVLGVTRMLWRVGRHNEEIEAGGSLSHQMFWPRQEEEEEEEEEEEAVARLGG